MVPPIQGGSTLSSTTAQLVPPLLCLLSAILQGPGGKRKNLVLSDQLCMRRSIKALKTERTAAAGRNNLIWDGSLTRTSTPPGRQVAVGRDGLGPNRCLTQALRFQIEHPMSLKCFPYSFSALAVASSSAPYFAPKHCGRERHLPASGLSHNSTLGPSNVDSSATSLEIIHSVTSKAVLVCRPPLRQSNFHPRNLTCTFEINRFLLPWLLPTFGNRLSISNSTCCS